jgi:uncharacterized membrane protein
MLSFLVLLVSFGIAVVVLRNRNGSIDWRLAGRIGMASMLLFTAFGHFLFSEGLAAVLPDFLPVNRPSVITTGFIEVLLALGLLYKRVSYLAAIVTIIFFILILPTHLKSVADSIRVQRINQSVPEVQDLYFRVPLQFIYIFWVFFFVIFRQDSPWKRVSGNVLFGW